MSKFVIGVLECPYYGMSDSEYWSKLQDIFLFKRDTYRTFYNKPIFSFGGEIDFCADHIVICEVVGDKLIPVAGSKVVTLERCREFSQKFPVVTNLRESGANELANLIEVDMMNSSLPAGRVAYHGSWTMDLKYQDQREKREQIKELHTAACINYFMEKGLKSVFGFGVPKVKTDSYFYSWGYERIKGHSGEETSSFALEFLDKQESVVMNLSEISFYGRRMAKEYRHMWSQRVIWGGNMEEEVEKGGEELVEELVG